MREFLKGLELDKETIDSIMAEHGKLITEAKEKTQELENKVKEYETKINELSANSEDKEKISKELEDLKQQIADKEAKEKAEANDKILTNNILEAIGDKKFVNDYTKNSIINEIKSQLSNTENQGKSAKDLFDSITKDKTDIFVSDNQIQDMPGMGDTETNTPKKDIPLVW